MQMKAPETPVTVAMETHFHCYKAKTILKEDFL